MKDIWTSKPKVKHGWAKEKLISQIIIELGIIKFDCDEGRSIHLKLFKFLFMKTKYLSKKLIDVELERQNGNLEWG